MALTNVWIASFFGPPPAAIGATPVWIAPNDGTVPSAVQSVIAGYFTPVAGASPVWIAGFFAPPPAAIGATPICISGWGGAVLVIPGSPVNTVAPVASGTLTVGSTLSCTTGTWTNSPTYTYQWQRGGANISGATSSTYVTVSADGGTSVGCLVTGTNASGSASQASNTLAIAGGVTSVWSASDAAANGYTLSNGNLTFNTNSITNRTIRGTISKTSGKLYVEFQAVATSQNYRVGLADATFNSLTQLGTSGYSCSISYGGNPVTSGFTSNYTTIIITPSVVRLAVDFSAGSLWYGADGAWVGGSNPANGSLPIISFVPATVGALFPAFEEEQVNNSWTLQPTPASQKYLPPPGFQAWDGGPVTPPATGYRYWRLNLTATTSNTYSLAEVQFRTTTGVPLLFSGGTASAGTTYGVAQGPYDAFHACDNDPSTFWSGNGADPIDWWEYDYEAGKAAIVEITIQARPDASYAQAPSAFALQWSDDGSTWTAVASFTATWTSAGQIQTFDVVTGATSVWSASDAAANAMTLSNGGLTVTTASVAANKSIRNSISKTSGKLYVEFLINTPAGDADELLGLASAGFNAGSYLGSSLYSVGFQPGNGVNYVSTGFTTNYGSGPGPFAVNDVWAIAVDFGAGSVWIAKNNVWFNSSNPATGSLPIVSFVAATVGALFATIGSYGQGTFTLQPTAASQKYAPPAGFSPWG